MDIVSAVVILCAAGASAALAYAAKIMYNHKLAEAFALGIDFGKAIAELTQEKIDQIVAENFPR